MARPLGSVTSSTGASSTTNGSCGLRSRRRTGASSRSSRSRTSGNPAPTWRRPCVKGCGSSRSGGAPTMLARRFPRTSSELPPTWNRLPPISFTRPRTSNELPPTSTVVPTTSKPLSEALDPKAEVLFHASHDVRRAPPDLIGVKCGFVRLIGNSLAAWATFSIGCARGRLCRSAALPGVSTAWLYNPGAVMESLSKLSASDRGHPYAGASHWSARHVDRNRGFSATCPPPLCQRLANDALRLAPGV